MARPYQYNMRASSPSKEACNRMTYKIELLFYKQSIPYPSKRLYLHTFIIFKVTTQTRDKDIQRTQVVVAIIAPYLVK